VNIKLEKADHKTQALTLLEAGEFCALGVYRGYRVDVKEMAVKERPDLKESRVIVTHSFEAAGSHEQIPCTEFMPPGTRKEDIKVQMQDGEACILTVSNIKGFSPRTCTPRKFLHLSKLLP